MKFELSRIDFNPAIQSILPVLPELDRQYLADLMNGHSVDSLNQTYLRQGWLLNFTQLFKLLDQLVHRNLILTGSVVKAFQNATQMNLGLSSNSSMASVSAAKDTSRWSLQDLPFFRSIDKKFADVLLKNAAVYSYQAETFVCKARELGRDLFVLLDGEAAIYRMNDNKSRSFVSLLHPKALFGEAGYFLGQPRTADIVTTKKSLILKIPCEESVLDRYLNIEKIESIQQRFWLQQALSRSDFFKNIPADSLDAILSAGSIVDLTSDQILFRQGDVGQSAFVVIQGSLNVLVDQIMARQLLQGSFLGEISLMMNQGRRSASVVAAGPTKLLKIDQGPFYQLLGQNLHLANQIQMLAESRLIDDSKRS